MFQSPWGPLRCTFPALFEITLKNAPRGFQGSLPRPQPQAQLPGALQTTTRMAFGVTGKRGWSHVEHRPRTTNPACDLASARACGGGRLKEGVGMFPVAGFSAPFKQRHPRISFRAHLCKQLKHPKIHAATWVFFSSLSCYREQAGNINNSQIK